MASDVCSDVNPLLIRINLSANAINFLRCLPSMGNALPLSPRGDTSDAGSIPAPARAFNQLVIGMNSVASAAHGAVGVNHCLFPRSSRIHTCLATHGRNLLHGFSFQPCDDECRCRLRTDGVAKSMQFSHSAEYPMSQQRTPGLDRLFDPSSKLMTSYSFQKRYSSNRRLPWASDTPARLESAIAFRSLIWGARGPSVVRSPSL